VASAIVDNSKGESGSHRVVIRMRRHRARESFLIEEVRNGERSAPLSKLRVVKNGDLSTGILSFNFAVAELNRIEQSVGERLLTLV